MEQERNSRFRNSGDRDNNYSLDNRGKGKRKVFTHRKACRFCLEKGLMPDYKNPKLLSSYISERGRIIPRRISGLCALHQRRLTTVIKRSRIMALLPFTATQRG